MLPDQEEVLLLRQNDGECDDISVRLLCTVVNLLVYLL